MAIRLSSLHEALAAEFPHAEIVEIAARESLNLEDWFEQITSSEQQAREAMEVDYDVYAEGESLLGWLNGTVQLSASEAFDAGEVLGAISTRHSAARSVARSRDRALENDAQPGRGNRRRHRSDESRAQ